MSDSITDRIAVTIAEHLTCDCGEYAFDASESGEHIAQVLVEELPAWDVLMSILDHTYPASVFPTLPDDPNRDPGPRIVSLIRRINEIREGDWM